MNPDKLLEQKIRDIAEEVYTEKTLKSKYTVAQVPFHRHNGTDSVRISAADLVNNNKNITLLIADGDATLTIRNLPNINRIDFVGFAANNAGEILELTAPVLVGATSATLSTAYGGATGSQNVLFSTGEVKSVSFTNASDVITWAGGLTLKAAATITINTSATERAIINGQAHFGRCYYFTGSGDAFDVNNTTVTGIPLIQACNSMYVKVTATAGCQVAQAPYLAFAISPAGVTVASLIITDFGDSFITLQSTIAAGWKLQGELILT